MQEKKLLEGNEQNWMDRVRKALAMPLGRSSSQARTYELGASLSGRPPKGELVGLDMGRGSVKMVTIHASKGGLRLTRVAEVGVERPWAGGDQSEIAAALTTLYRQKRVRQKKIAAVYPGSNLIIRHIELPRMSPDELRGLLRWDVEQYVPLPKEDSVVDFQIIGEQNADPNAETMRVLLVGAQKQPVLDCLKVLHAAHLTALAIDIHPLAAWRAVHLDDGVVGGVEVIIDMGASTTRLSIFADGVLQTSRAIPRAGTEMTLALSRALAISPDEAELIKRDRGLTDHELRGPLRSVIDPLVEEILRSVEFFLYRNRDLALQAVHLVGGTAKLQGLREHLEQELAGLVEHSSAPHHPLVHLYQLPASLSVDPQLEAQLQVDAPVYATALGLAMREATP